MVRGITRIETGGQEEELDIVSALQRLIYIGSMVSYPGEFHFKRYQRNGCELKVDCGDREFVSVYLESDDLKEAEFFEIACLSFMHYPSNHSHLGESKISFWSLDNYFRRCNGGVPSLRLRTFIYGRSVEERSQVLLYLFTPPSHFDHPEYLKAKQTFERLKALLPHRGFFERLFG